MAKPKAIQLYLDYREELDELNYEEKGRLLDAILDYASNDTIPDFSDNVGLRIIFKTMKKSIDRDFQNYHTICNIRKEASAKGVAARKKKDEEKSCPRANTEKDNGEAAFAVLPKQTAEPVEQMLYPDNQTSSNGSARGSSATICSQKDKDKDKEKENDKDNEKNKDKDNKNRLADQKEQKVSRADGGLCRAGSTREMQDAIVISEVIEYLNQQADTNYRSTAVSSQKYIRDLLRQGYTPEDIKTVIDKKCAEWKDTEYAKYLRPDTLFGTRFESYLHAPVPKKTFRSNQKPRNPNAWYDRSDDSFMRLADEWERDEESFVRQLEEWERDNEKAGAPADTCS